MLDHAAARSALRTRLLTQGNLPTARAWENEEFTPVRGTSYVTEEYVPGPVAGVTLGPLHDLDYRGSYMVGFYAATDTGTAALDALAASTLALFPPGQAMTLTTGDVLRVGDDPAPYRGQILYDGRGWAFVLVTIPLWARSANTI